MDRDAKTELLGSRIRRRGTPPAALLLAVLALLAIAVWACNGDDDDAADDSEPDATASPEASATVTPLDFPTETPEVHLPPGCSEAGLTSELDLGDGQYEVGEPVDINVTFTNCGDTPVRLFYATEQRYEFIIEDPGGVEVWRWSEGLEFAEVAGEQEVPVGESVEYTETWDQTDLNGEQVDPGRYKVSAFSIGCAREDQEDCVFGPVGFVDVRR